MEHKKEWHTCDRCGAEIKVKPISELEFMPIGDYLLQVQFLKMAT